jgi:GntR family transcriptional repressor for pyruvate dehydrogenase complex
MANFPPRFVAAGADASSDRLYQGLARRLFAELASGKYKVGDRLPAEREMALEHDVSRPTVREAIIALEVQGFIEVRVGSGAYVRKLPGGADAPAFDVSAFELIEARLLVEGEAAALAATQLGDDELDQLDTLLAAMADEAGGMQAQFEADRHFHLLIARGTRNAAMRHLVEELWRMRASSPESALLHDRARDAKVTPVVDEHSAVLRALRARDAAGARAAMRAHLGAVLDHLLFATEEQAVQEARASVAVKRARFNTARAI